jgi:PAS domain S-box-containing protein
MAVIPAVGLRLYTYTEQRQLAAVHAKEEAMRMAQLVSNSQSQVIEEARSFLYTLAKFSDIRDCDRRQYAALFANLLRQYPRYLNIAAADSDGNVFASALPLSTPVNVSDCSCFQSALRTSMFSIGNYTIGPIVGKPTLRLAYPVTDGSGNPRSVFFVSLDLTWLNHLNGRSQLPQGSTLTLIDEGGTILTRYPDADKWAGKTLRETPIVQTILSQGRGTTEAADFDGTARLYAFVPIKGMAAAGNLYVSVGIPASIAYSGVNKLLTRNVIILTIVLITLAALWFGMDLLVLRRLNLLVGAAKRLGSGDLSARTGIPLGRGELNQLASTFDEMAVSLERREAEMRRSEEELRGSERRYRELADLLPETVFETDERGILTFANRISFTVFGYTEDDFRQGLSLFQMVVTEDRDRARKSFLEAVRKEKSEHEYVMQRKDGSTFPGLVHSVPIVRGGKVCGLRGFVIDFTDRKRTEKALQDSEERYRTIFNTTGTGMVIAEEDTTISLVNTEFEKLSGYAREEVEGKKSWTELIDQEFLETMTKYHRMRRIHPHLAPTSYESRFIDKEGRLKDILLTVSLIPGTLKSVASFFEITAQKRAEKEMETLREQFLQSQKMEAVGRLAGGIAHDFNNLMTVIGGYSQLALIDLKKQDPLRRNIEEINAAADRASRLTRQMLAFSRRQIFEMRVLDLNSILLNLGNMLCRILGEDIKLTTFLASDLGRIETDAGQIEQVIMNLTVNARDAMPEGGKLIIETANVLLDEEYARSHIAVRPGPYVMLSVSDTGCGMTPAVKERVFEPFFTTKEIGKGTGLGLSTVYGIVKQSGGNIWVYSEPGQGTVFKIYLPRVDKPAEELQAGVKTDEVPQGNETILIIEDDESVRRLSSRVLNKQGYTVLEAHQEHEALSLCKERKEPIHLILADVIMPEINGRKLIDHLKEVRQDFKVLFMSGYAEDAIAHHGVLDRGVELIQKPFTFERLARKVREVLDK